MNAVVSVASVASANAVAAPSITPSQTQDPIFGLIEAHKKARADFSKAVRIEFALEEELPGEKTRSRRWNGEWTIAETDDPRWIAAGRATDAASDYLENLALKMVDDANAPTTVAGVTAILAYVAQVATEGDDSCWPEGLQDDEWEPAPIKNRHSDVPYQTFLCRTLSRALAKMQPVVEGQGMNKQSASRKPRFIECNMTVTEAIERHKVAQAAATALEAADLNPTDDEIDRVCEVACDTLRAVALAAPRDVSEAIARAVYIEAEWRRFSAIETSLFASLLSGAVRDLVNY